jgi:hypothetical protein
MNTYKPRLTRRLRLRTLTLRRLTDPDLKSIATGRKGSLTPVECHCTGYLTGCAWTDYCLTDACPSATNCILCPSGVCA